jgi:hypothetical protein
MGEKYFVVTVATLVMNYKGNLNDIWIIPELALAGVPETGLAGVPPAGKPGID